MAPKTVAKKGSPKATTSKTVTPAPVPVEKPKTTAVNKNRNRHQYDRVTHQVFTPFFTGLEQHLSAKLCTDSPVTIEQVREAILSYDVKSYFQKQFEGKGRRSNKKKNGTKRQLSTFMLFQEEMRGKISKVLEKDLGRKPSQPEVVRQLGKVWTQMKKSPDGIEKYKQLYAENKRKAQATENLPASDDES